MLRSGVNSPRVAVVGAGLMGHWHAEAARQAGGTVVAIVDENLSRAEKLAARFPGAEGVATLGQAFEARAIEVVHLCTPTATHVDLARQALVAGAHVLAEKPLAPTRATTTELLELATAQGRLLCPTHQFVFQTGVQQVLGELPHLGPLVHVEYATCSAGAEGLDEVGRDRVAGEILPHPLALLTRAFPGQISELEWQVRHPAPGEFRVATTIGRTSVVIFISMAGRPTLNQIQFIGQRASATADMYHGFRVTEPGTVSRLHKAGRPFVRSGLTSLAALFNLADRAVHRELAYPGLRELVRRFYQAVEAGTAPPITPEETLEVAAARDTLIGLLGLEPQAKAI